MSADSTPMLIWVTRILNDIQLWVSVICPFDKGLFPGAPWAGAPIRAQLPPDPSCRSSSQNLVAVSWDLVSLTFFPTRKNRSPPAPGPEPLVAVLDPVVGGGRGPWEVAVDGAG